MLLDEHKANEVNYGRKLKAYRETYPQFIYESPFVTPKDSFIQLDMDQFQVGINEEAIKV